MQISVGSLLSCSRQAFSASPLLWRPAKGTFWLRVPNFQHWKGVNDRFAYGTRDAMVKALLNEFNVMSAPGQSFGTGSEGKMCDYLRSFEGPRMWKSEPLTWPLARTTCSRAMPAS